MLLLSSKEPTRSNNPHSPNLRHRCGLSLLRARSANSYSSLFQFKPSLSHSAWKPWLATFGWQDLAGHLAGNIGTVLAGNIWLATFGRQHLASNIWLATSGTLLATFCWQHLEHLAGNIGTFGGLGLGNVLAGNIGWQHLELIYVTFQGFQLAVEALELVLKKKFCTALFCMSCECDFFWHGESMDRNHSACFSKPFFVGLLVGRSVRLSVAPSGPRSDVDAECL